ncbi:MAG: hypothetical protein AAGD00_02480 [Planctomycetota bacterium]
MTHTHQTDHAPRRKSARERRGTIILLALGALAVISIAAIAYVTVVRIDRGSALLTSRDQNFRQQVNIVTEHIGDLLAADLFGNKIVTLDTPRNSRGVVNRPSMFEDGEFWDYPYTYVADDLDPEDRYTFDRRDRLDLNTNPTTNAIITSPTPPSTSNALFNPRPPAALTDDAWLASAEPDWNLNGYPNIRAVDGSLDTTYRWPQVTNLRSAYRFVPDDSFRPDLGGSWVRSDGRFVDLARFFESSDADDFGDPGVDFLSLPNNEGRAILPAAGRGDPQSPGDLNDARNSTDVFDVQIDELASIDPEGNDASFLHTDYDERYWVDADGDLRADSRWTQLDALAGAFGYVWFVGARVIDASSMVNFNASIESGIFNGFATDPGRVHADGRTPADIALERLLFDKRPLAVFDGSQGTREVITDELMPFAGQASYNKHVTRGLRLPGFTKALVDARTMPGTGIPAGQAETPWGEVVTQFLTVAGGADNQAYDDGDFVWSGFSPTLDRVTTPAQRYQFYALFGGSPTAPVNGTVGGYPYRELIDLQSFWGTGSSAVNSRFEQNIDPDDRLPSSEDLTTMPDRAAGPLRSIETGDEARGLFSQNAPFPNPTPRMLHDSVRRFLTPYSGVSDVSPVPNFREDATPNRKTNLIDLAVNSSRNLPTEIPRNIFESFVWALAPLATDQPLSGSLAENGTAPFANGRDGRSFDASADNPEIARAIDLHYGGGTPPTTGAPSTGEAERFFGPEGGAAYAVTTAGALTVNLLDASDEDNIPTVVRVIGTFDGEDLIVDRDDTEAIELGLNFDHGSVRIPMMSTPPHPMADFTDPQQDFGTALTTYNREGSGAFNPRGGMTLVGLERQPFLVGALSIAIYAELAAATLDDFAGDNTIDYDSPAEQLGSILVFELYNPWPEDILANDLDDYHVVIPESANAIGLGDANRIRLRLPNVNLPAGERRTFYIASEAPTPDNGLWGDTRDELIQALRNDIAGATVPPGGAIPAVVDDTALVAIDSTGSVDATFASNPIMFADPGSAPVPRPVLLMRDINDDLSQDGVIDVRDWVLVDRLSGHEQVTLPSVENEFPKWFTGSEDVMDDLVGDAEMAAAGYNTDPLADTRFQTRIATGRVAVASSLSRSANVRADSTGTGAPVGGFPTAVIDVGNDTSFDAGSGRLASFINNFGFDAIEDSDRQSAWVIGGNFWMLPTLPDPGDRVAQRDEPWRSLFNSAQTLKENFADLHELGESPDAAGTEILPANFPGFQLFVPDAPLKTVADLHMLTKFAHRCADNDLDNLNAWVTVGEQIANSLVYDHSADFDGTNTPNPYAATLDPTRYVLTVTGTSGGGPNSGDLESVQGLPDSMAVPLATRVFDPFTALPSTAYANNSVAHGVININTAPRQVLETLPLLVPLGDIQGAGAGTTSVLPATSYGIDQGFMNTAPAGNALAEPGPDNRALLIREYRDREHNPLSMFNIVAGTGGITRAEFTNINGLRGGRQSTRFGNGTGERPGITSLGELSILGQWEDLDASSPTTVQPHPVGTGTGGNPGMMALADRDLPSGRQTFGSPLDLYNPTVSPNADGSGPTENDGAGYVIAENDPADDVEERLAIFRAISNVVSTRSDVYLAWFVLRGYDPRDVESVNLSGTGTADAMQDPFFEPAYESRWLVLYDRSNVRKPTDRPRVLMQVEVPIEQRPQ